MTLERHVGDVIRWSSGGSVHAGTITEVREYRHVKVDSWPVVIPPTWILDDEPTED